MLMPPEVQNTNQPPTNWQYNSAQPGSDGSQFSQPIASQTQPSTQISWTASEFIAYQKNKSWYVLAVAGVILVAGLIFFVTKDTISTIVTISLGVLFIVFASRKPRVLNYEISDKGIRIGDKLHLFRTMKSFAVIEEGTIRSIDILPMQRFMPAISMYYDPKDEDVIISSLGKFLPQENREQPLIDKLMHKIRF